MYHEKLSYDIGLCINFGYQCFLNFNPKNLRVVGKSSFKISSTKRNFSPKIFGIFGIKSSKPQRFFENLKWTGDKDKDGSLAKNLRRTMQKLCCNTEVETWPTYSLTAQNFKGKIWIDTINKPASPPPQAGWGGDNNIC